MENTSIRLELGVIICKYCSSMIGTLDSEKVTTYYSDCQEPVCLETRDHKGDQPGCC